MNFAHNIYIHVPFCVAKCRYCAFFSRACANPNWDEYAKGIIAQVQYWAEKLGRISVPTIFFGGGTPSLMPAAIFEKIIGAIQTNFTVLGNAEITIEANPATMDDVKLREFQKIGMNRISVGVQSLDDDKLAFLGRIHNADDARKLIDAAMNLGLRVSADFIYGLPGEVAHDAAKLAHDINNIGLSHCSMYELTIEENTPLGKMKPDMPDNDTMAEMYTAIQDTLALPRYEVSNYAVPGQECRHNLNVWEGEPYIGIGAGAAGRIMLNGVWYEQAGNYRLFNPISDSTRAIERLITGLRTVRGVRIDDQIEKIINMEFAKSHPDMLCFNGDRIAATNAGFLVLDDITEKLVK